MLTPKKRVKLEEIKRLFEAKERLTTKELKAYTNLTERTLRNYLAQCVVFLALLYPFVDL